MVRQVKISNFTEVQGIVAAAIKCHNEVGVHDIKGSIADAKSHSTHRSPNPYTPAGGPAHTGRPLRLLRCFAGFSS